MKNAIRRAIARRQARRPAAPQLRQGTAPDYGYSADPTKLTERFSATRKVSVGELSFSKGDTVYVRYTGSAGVYDLINEDNEQHRLDPEEMQALMADGSIVPEMV